MNVSSFLYYFNIIKELFDFSLFRCYILKHTYLQTLTKAIVTRFILKIGDIWLNVLFHDRSLKLNELHSFVI